MKARVIRSFVDKYTLARVAKGTEIEITEKRFSELTTGPRGVFVKKIEEDSQERTTANKPDKKESNSKKAPKK